MLLEIEPTDLSLGLPDCASPWTPSASRPFAGTSLAHPDDDDDDDDFDDFDDDDFDDDFDDDDFAEDGEEDCLEKDEIEADGL